MLTLDRADLDLVFVPTGLVFLMIYHLYLLYKIIKHPNSTAIGFENGNKRIWVRKMMEDMPRNTSTALQVISNNTSTATYLISLSITLSSLIGTIVGSSPNNSQAKGLVNEIIYGDRSLTTASVKYATLMLCFLTAFMAHVQCIRYYIHVSYLISTPGSSVPVHYVENAVVRGSNFWSLGLRAYYFAFPLLLWIFGPIPMFTCCLVMVSFLYFLDSKDNSTRPFGIKEEQTVLYKEIETRGQVIESSSGKQALGIGNMLMPQIEFQQLQLQCNS
ncbi:hypothetical protein SUGI_1095350 [Cryptomeria japonica]|uniref:uncharacterized protein LOC131072268 n=1 Tax=Cryptomeria japonica TaxID=3369 RepID=UPI00241474B8|nr:uncharacterized protein LOC131072268 [Cryptomeria japonica]GLJ51534.1 hypothetical protein SUGI_1095350 [Cryptomeria japonica]